MSSDSACDESVASVRWKFELMPYGCLNLFAKWSKCVATLRSLSEMLRPLFEFLEYPRPNRKAYQACSYFHQSRLDMCCNIEQMAFKSFKCSIKHQFILQHLDIERYLHIHKCMRNGFGRSLREYLWKLYQKKILSKAIRSSIYFRPLYKITKGLVDIAVRRLFRNYENKPHFMATPGTKFVRNDQEWFWLDRTVRKTNGVPG